MIRRAQIQDARTIQELINYYAHRGFVLPRSLNEIYEDLRDFFVAEENKKIVGCVALHISWQDLAEARSLVVKKTSQGKGIGRELLGEALSEAKRLQIKRVFTLTRIPAFFKKAGFRPVSKAKLPQKIWGDCINCPKFPDCNEVPLIIRL